MASKYMSHIQNQNNTIPIIPRGRVFLRNQKWVRSDAIPNEVVNKKWIRSEALTSEAARSGLRSLTTSPTSSEGAGVAQPTRLEQQPALTRAGKHKLILPTSTNSSTVIATSRNSVQTSNNRKRRQPSSMCTTNVVVVKRIPLHDNTSAGSGGTASSSNEQILTSSPPKGNEHGADKLIPSSTNAANPSSRLTDFAYRCLPATAATLRSHDATGPKSALSYNRGRDSHNVWQSKTTQLIRVKPGEDPQQVFAIDKMKREASRSSATSKIVTSSNKGNSKFIRNQPASSYSTSTLQHKNECRTTNRICPDVMSGEECTNVYCTKRHDIPRTMATPICTFFQRHGGQCHKGDSCRFLHVKLNPQAEICSVFQIYGHCSAGESCPKKHIRATHPKTTNKTDSRITNT